MAVDKQLGLKIIKFLNEVLELDHDLVLKFVNNRIDCNDKIQNHPTIQCVLSGQVGLLGLLNGLVGIHDNGPKAGWGCIAAEYEDNNCKKILRFMYIDEEVPVAGIA